MECKQCGAEFEPRSWNAAYCSAKCRNKARYARHRDYLRAYWKEYQAANKEIINKKQLQRYYAHRDELLAKQRERYWRKKNDNGVDNHGAGGDDRQPDDGAGVRGCERPPSAD